MDTAQVQKLLQKLDYGPAPESDGKVRAWLKRHGAKFGHFIGGEFRPPVGDAYFETKDPSDGKKLADIAQGTAEDVDAAMAAAASAFPAWSALSGFARAKYLYAIARAIAKHARLFAVLETLDNGKTIRETRDIDIPLGIRHFYY
ncbi:MAG: aldehyde dehydrogenase family protein, partial [bacterium]|nr:aldehyde dehydrogenase family protein [bacterium]